MALRSAPTLSSEIVDLLFPCFCLGCGERLRSPAPALLLCLRCRGKLQPSRAGARCPTCARSLPEAAQPTVCAGCRSAPPPFDRLCAGWSYRPPLDQVIHALKFAQLEFLALDLARLSLDGEALAGEGPWDLAVPVPLAPWRRLVRGFNQAERIAAALSTRLGLPCREALIRRGFAPTPQAVLGARQRRQRMTGRMYVRRREEVRGQRILLVDDVMTTGATLAAAATALRDAGAGTITAFAVALAPLPGPPRLS